MKLHILIFFILIFCISSFGQTKKSSIKTNTKPRRTNTKVISKSTADALLTDIKTLTKDEKLYSLKILKLLDAADSLFSMTKDSVKFFDAVRRAYSEYEKKEANLH